VRTLSRLLRVLGATARAAVDAAPPTLAAGRMEAVHDLLTRCVLPAAALIPANPGLVAEVWAVLSALPYTDRFALYADLSVSLGLGCGSRGQRGRQRAE
jgi:hypothetical protein